jgi:hypothetical protein
MISIEKNMLFLFFNSKGAPFLILAGLLDPSEVNHIFFLIGVIIFGFVLFYKISK